MGWKMNKDAVLKRQKAEKMFTKGFGPLRVSRELETNFHIVRDWKTAWKNKVEKRNQGNTPLNRTIAASLFNFGYGYRAVGKMLNLSSIWLSRDWARKHRQLSRMKSIRAKRGDCQ